MNRLEDRWFTVRSMPQEEVEISYLVTDMKSADAGKDLVVPR